MPRTPGHIRTRRDLDRRKLEELRRWVRARIDDLEPTVHLELVWSRSPDWNTPLAEVKDGNTETARMLVETIAYFIHQGLPVPPELRAYAVEGLRHPDPTQGLGLKRTRRRPREAQEKLGFIYLVDALEIRVGDKSKAYQRVAALLGYNDVRALKDACAPHRATVEARLKNFTPKERELLVLRAADMALAWLLHPPAEK